MPNILDLSARLSADVKPFVNSMGSSAQASASSFQAIAQAATMYLGGRGLLGTLNAANQAAMSFGQSMADASAISTLSVAELKKTIFELDNVFGRASKASASMYRILSSGFSKLNAKELQDFQKAVSVSAKVIRADLYNTADVMTTIANAYQLNIDQIKNLQDWFYLTVREGKAQGQDLARTLGLVINSASEAGVSLNELGAAIAVLSRTQSVSQSMIGLNQMLNAFIKPTLQAQAAARKWGIELNATALQTRGLTSFLTELHEKVGGNVEALEAMFGNIRAGRAILSLTGKQFQNYLNVLSAYNTEQGGGAEAFAKQIDTLENAYERFQAQQEKTLITVGDDWEGVRKSIYRTGEAMLKAFSDTSSVNRWVVYLTGIGLAVKNIIGVVRNLKSSIEGVTHSVDNLSSSFIRASMASHGLTGVYSGARPDTLALRKELDRSLRTTTGDYSPLAARYKTIMGSSVPAAWSNLKNIRGFYKQTPYSFIGQHMLSENVAEHRAIARNIARRLIKNRLVKYEDITDAQGNVTDWKVLDAVTGKKYAKPMSWFEDQTTKDVLRQSKVFEKAARGDLASAIKIIGGAKGREKQILAAADARVNAFYSNGKGGRMSSLYNMSSLDRLQRMRNKGIFSGTSYAARRAVFREKGFAAGMKNEFSVFGQSIGSGMGKAFSAAAIFALGSSVWEIGYKFGKEMSSAFELSQSEFIRKAGTWLSRYFDENWIPTAYGGAATQYSDYKDAERAGYQAQMFVTQGRYQQSLKRARMAGMDEDKILEYQMNYMKILNQNDDLESATNQLRDLVNDFTKQIDALNSKIERANKFEKERVQLLESYGKKSLAETITSAQKVKILEKATDFSKFAKDEDVVRLARQAIGSGGELRNLSSAERKKVVDENGELQPAFIEALGQLLKMQLVEGIFNGNIDMNELRKIYGKSFYYQPGAGMQQATGILGWLKNGELLQEKPEEGGLALNTNVIRDVLNMFDENPNNIEEAKKEALINVVRPYVASKFTELLDNVNDLVADIGEDILSIEDLPLDVETSENLYAEKAKRSRAVADTFERKYRIALEQALQERGLIIDAVRANILATIPDMPVEEIDNEVARQMEQYDKTFTSNIATVREKVLRAAQTATNQEEKANNVRVAKVGDRLTGRLNQIEMLSIRNRITSYDEAKRKIWSYKKAVDDYNRELKIIGKKDSDAYKQTRKMRDEALKNMYREQANLISVRSAAREQLMGVLGNVVSSNLDNGRLTNYGMQHAMNLLSRLSPAFKFNVGGADLQTVMNNARARYSGSTPDVSRAMQQQRRLSTIMDAYITAKQYEDAGIGKNVQTIVTIMGKRQPLYLN